MTNPADTLAKFENDLTRKGAATAPNGADYKIVTPDDGVFAVERVFKGSRETIVGFNGCTFDTLSAARHWAYTDGRHVMLPGAILPSRKQII